MLPISSINLKTNIKSNLRTRNSQNLQAKMYSQADSISFCAISMPLIAFSEPIKKGEKILEELFGGVKFKFYKEHPYQVVFLADGDFTYEQINGLKSIRNKTLAKMAEHLKNYKKENEASNFITDLFDYKNKENITNRMIAQSASSNLNKFFVITNFDCKSEFDTIFYITKFNDLPISYEMKKLLFNDNSVNVGKKYLIQPSINRYRGSNPGEIIEETNYKIIDLFKNNKILDL